MYYSNGQLFVFICFVFVGMLIAFTYYLTHLNFLSKLKFFVHIKDALFVVITFLLCSQSLLYLNYGELRVFVLVAAVLGILLFNATFKVLLDKLK